MIRVPEVRVVTADGAQLGVLSTPEALRRAQEEGLDLVEVAPTARPPVCRIMDFGKYKYEQDKKRREARKHQSQSQLKEIQLRPSINRHDLEVKLRHVRRFLEEGDKAKITVRFRGREMAHRELGMAMLERVIQEIGELAKIDQAPRFEGRMLFTILTPAPGGKHAKAQNQ